MRGVFHDLASGVYLTVPKRERDQTPPPRC
jgi:hypothetical protein